MPGFGATRSRGLVLGKFAPLHRGHQLLIETALAEMDEVCVVVYDSPEVTSIPLPERARWLREIYPGAVVVEAWGGPAEVGDTPALRGAHERYVIETLGIGGITHFYSSEFYGRHMSRALGAVDRQVDSERKRVPVSASMIRKAPYDFREYLSPRVYRDLITNVVFLGAPSTGKTTIAAALAGEYGTCWMPEYGREYWERHQVGRRLSAAQLADLAEEHLRREEDLLCRSNRFLFTDTNALTTYVFSMRYHRRADERLIRMAAKASVRYDLVFLCETDMPYEDTDDRSGAEDRSVMQRMVESDLLSRKIPFVRLRGDHPSRMAAVRELLSTHHRYRSLGETCAASRPARGREDERGSR